MDRQTGGENKTDRRIDSSSDKMDRQDRKEKKYQKKYFYNFPIPAPVSFEGPSKQKKIHDTLV
jgi:hypothetical protein